MTTDERYNALLPIAEAMSWASYWIKTDDGPRHVNRPFTYELLRQHAAQVKAFGLCPIKPGEETTRVACVDLDSHKGETPWREMLLAAREISSEAAMCGIRLRPFRSSGGQGVHLYGLWAEPYDAFTIRSYLTEAIHDAGFTIGTGGVVKREVELFPKQDNVPADGHGSMFILPFAGKSEPIDLAWGYEIV